MFVPTKQGQAVFPTHVGVFLVVLAVMEGSPGLPHARGGVSPYVALSSACAESSPRTWGCFQRPLHTPAQAFVFPTHVGVFLRGWRCAIPRTGLPHARGGVSRHSSGFCVFSRSSPRTWGCFFSSYHFLRFRRVFPTHVGVFLRGDSSVKRACGLPHARGGVSAKKLR